MRVRSLKLQDVDFGREWRDKVVDRWVYDDFQADPRWKNGWISFDCILYRPEDERLYLGVTCFDANKIFVAYDRRAGKFVDLDYHRVADPYDAKFHRSLVHGPDGCIYASPALLHCPDRFFTAPGAAIVRYNPVTGELTKPAIPLPHVYTQSLVVDTRRQVLYLLNFAPEYLSKYDLRTGESRILALLNSGYGPMAQGENIVLDEQGCVWCNWQLTRAWQDSPGPDALRFCKYDPDADRVIYYSTGLPRIDGRPGFAKCESYFNFGDGWLYAGGANGSFFRIDPESGAAELVCTPTLDRPSRLAAMVKTDEGTAYGITGRGGRCELMRVYYKEGRYEKLGPVVDAQGRAMYQCHDITVAADGTLYACENDNPERSSYLWEIQP